VIGPVYSDVLLGLYVGRHGLGGLGFVGAWLWGMPESVMEPGRRRACDRACL
jgi:hypothetical protein